MRRIVWYSPTQTNKIRTRSSLWETGSDFVFSTGNRFSQTVRPVVPNPLTHDPVAYADLILNGDVTEYLRNVTDYRPLDERE